VGYADSVLRQAVESWQQELQRVPIAINDKWARIATTVEETRLTPYKEYIALEVYGIDIEIYGFIGG
jgi:hypothetical protein